MSSRFTEIFHATNHPWELCNSEPSSPSLSTSTSQDSFLSSSSDTLNTLPDLNAYSNMANTYPHFIHQTHPLASALSSDDIPSSTSTKPIKSKFKLILSSIGSIRRNKK